VELLGIRSLSFAVGSYLSIGTTAAIFCGGVVRWLAERDRPARAEDETGPGALYASGLIAAGGVFGLLAIALTLLGQVKTRFAWLAWFPTRWSAVGAHLGLQDKPVVAVIAFALLGFSLYHFARKPLEVESPASPEKPRTEA